VTKPTDCVWFFTRTLAPRQYLVEYRTRIKRVDQIEVTIPENLEDDPAVAELAAMHQVLVVKGALGETRGGNGVRMVVSRGAVRKAARRMTSKRYLVPLARFLSTRFAQAEIEVDHEGRWAEPGICRTEAEKLIASKTLGDIVNLPGLGPAEISHHVVGQIARRYQVDSDLGPGGCWRRPVPKGVSGRLLSRPENGRECWSATVYRRGCFTTDKPGCNWWWCPRGRQQRAGIL
jgi:hypothetical protein